MEWLLYTEPFMRHLTCLGDRIVMVWHLAGNHAVTICVYSVLTFFSLWAARFFDGSLRALCQSFALVFVFCAINYSMQIVVIWWPVYRLQATLGSLANFMYIPAVVNGVHVFKDPRIYKASMLMVRLLKDLTFFRFIVQCMKDYDHPVSNS